MTDADKTVFEMVRDSLQDCIDANTATDPVQRPAHYVLVTPRGPLEITRDVIAPWLERARVVGCRALYYGTALQYILRAPHKGTELQDLRKARQYLGWLIEHKEAE